MKSLRIVLAIASLATWTACVVAPVEEGGVEEEIGERASALVFPSDRDINASGPMSYGANWAKDTFNPYPGLYIYDDGQGFVHGSVYLSPGTVCKFWSYDDDSGHLYIASNDCSGPVAGLRVRLDCLKQVGQLSCNGLLEAGNGAQSGMSGTLAKSVVCAPDGCYEGPFPPGPSGPDGPADCPEGQSPCGANGCCGEGQRCGNSGCWTPEEGDEETAETELK